MKSKKGNLNALYPAILALVLVGVLLSMSLLVMGKFQTNMFTQDQAGPQVANESLTSVEEHGEYLAAYAYRDGKCAVTRCQNTTGDVIIPAANWTEDSECHVKWNNANSNNGYNGSNWECTYEYTWDADTVESNATADFATAMKDIATTWMPVFVVAIAAAIVLAIILGFGGSRRTK